MSDCKVGRPAGRSVKCTGLPFIVYEESDWGDGTIRIAIPTRDKVIQCDLPAELAEDFGYDLHDFGARMLSAIGRKTLQETG